MTSWAHRAASEADLAAIAALDAECFGNPWSQDVYRQELYRPFARLNLAEADGVLLGSSCVWVMAEEAHLLRIATAPGHRRRGLGRALLTRVLVEVEAERCHRILLEVGARNEAAVRLYESFGFETIGRRVGYYRHPPDDALVMQRVLAASPQAVHDP